MNPILLNAMVGGAVGICSSFIGFVGNSRTSNFEIQKAVPTLLVGIVAGALAGVLSPDYKTAISAALGGDVLRKAATHFVAQGATPPQNEPPK